MDIKPQNVMIAEDNSVIKLIDFGVSVEINPESKKTNFKLRGTSRYLSPDQLSQ